MVRANIAGFYRSAGREAPMGLDMDALVLMALTDWSGIPDADLDETCARARNLAAKRPGNWPATTADVLRGYSDLSHDAYRLRTQRQEEERKAAIASGRLLPEPTLTEMSEEGRQAALTEFRKAAGLE